MESLIEVDYLIVGAGPAGSALACFLGQNGLNGLVIAKTSGTADTPRAHVTNPPALECLRDIGLEQDALDLGSPTSYFGAIRWCRSMCGEEFGRLLAWSNAAQRLSDLAAASPCTYVDLPQSFLEPILVKYATQHGFEIRFSTEVTSIERLNGGSCLCHAHDTITGFQYKIRTKFLFGADGARSQVSRSLDYQYSTKPSGALAYNIFFKANLEHIVSKERYAGLNFIVNPECQKLQGTMSTIRMVRPWNQWILASISHSADHHPFQGHGKQSSELIDAIREAVGDTALEVEIMTVDTWTPRDSVAKSYSDLGGANAFLLGDAAHRHPPAYGLGSNTCIQDAYNLGWKVAYVSKGFAGPDLLASYNKERQPVGAMLVKESNHQLQAGADVFAALGINPTSTSKSQAIDLAKLSQASEEGNMSRLALHKALENK